jgi:hypothetical protein
MFPGLSARTGLAGSPVRCSRYLPALGAQAPWIGRQGRQVALFKVPALEVPWTVRQPVLVDARQSRGQAAKGDLLARA